MKIDSALIHRINDDVELLIRDMNGKDITITGDAVSDTLKQIKVTENGLELTKMPKPKHGCGSTKTHVIDGQETRLLFGHEIDKVNFDYALDLELGHCHKCDTWIDTRNGKTIGVE